MKKLHKILSIAAAVLLAASFTVSKVDAASNFDIEGGILYDYFGDGGDIVIPNGVTGIDSGAFKNNTDIVSVVIPEGVTSIGNETFRGCSELKKAVLPESLIFTSDPATCDGGETFKDCTSLTDVTISSKALCIPRNFFAGCISLTNFTVPETVQAVGEFAFCQTALKEITFPEGCSSFGLGAMTMINNASNGVEGLTCTVTIYCQNPQFDVGKKPGDTESPLFGFPEQTSCKFYAQGIAGGTFENRIQNDISAFGVNASFKQVTVPVKETVSSNQQGVSSEDTVSDVSESAEAESSDNSQTEKTAGISTALLIAVVVVLVVVVAAAAVVVVIVLKRSQAAVQAAKETAAEKDITEHNSESNEK